MVRRGEEILGKASTGLYYFDHFEGWNLGETYFVCTVDGDGNTSNWIPAEPINSEPLTVLHPGHIAGPGWRPVNPLGNLNTEVFVKLAHGEELVMPNFGLETLHHVHAEDAAQAFIKSIGAVEKAQGQEFHVVSEKALTLRGYADKVAQGFGQEANLKFKPFEQWKTQVDNEEAEATYDHIAHSPNCSIEKAKRLLDYKPKYSSIEAVIESLKWLIDNGQIII